MVKTTAPSFDKDLLLMRHVEDTLHVASTEVKNHSNRSVICIQCMSGHCCQRISFIQTTMFKNISTLVCAGQFPAPFSGVRTIFIIR
jgi:hypothetical protein